MANDNRASYLKIGLTVVIGVVAVVGTLIRIGGMHGRNELLVETCYDNPVNGLSVGSAVFLRGVQIGEVREIGFVGDKYRVDGTDKPRIYILMAISRGVLGFKDMDEASVRDHIADLVNRRGMRATVSSSGITGLSRIDIDFNLRDAPEQPKISWTPENAYIPAKYSLLDNFSQAATKVMNQINKMDLSGAWSNVNASVEALSRAMDAAQVMIETRQADLERLMEDISSSAMSVRELTAELKRNPSLLIRERVPAPLDETR